MTPRRWRVRRDVTVEADLLSIANWIAKDSRDATERFLIASEETITGLSHMP